MRLMLVSSLPNALVATQVNSAESLRSSFLMLKSDNTPVGRISSRIVYLQQFGHFVLTELKFIRKFGKLPRVALGIQSFAVHVPQDADGFLAFGLTLEHGRFTTAGSLIFEFNFKLRRSCFESNGR